MDYPTLKLLHQATVLLSIGGFVVRGVAALRGAHWVRGRAARTWPHVLDTLLLGSALGLAWTTNLNPLQTPWLAAKIVGLLLYIGLGLVALRPALPLQLRLAAFVAALLCLAQIVAMAISKSVAGLLIWV